MGKENLVLFLVVGVAAGLRATRVMARAGYGMTADLVVGMAGACLGAWLYAVTEIAVGGIVASLSAALLGSLGLLYVLRLTQGRWATPVPLPGASSLESRASRGVSPMQHTASSVLSTLLVRAHRRTRPNPRPGVR